MSKQLDADQLSLARLHGEGVCYNSNYDFSLEPEDVLVSRPNLMPRPILKKTQSALLYP